jgi:Synergist-CTERM protein sorting domain-containing protein
VTLPPNPTEEQKKDALENVLREALVPDSLIEDLLELLEVDDTGQVRISDDGMERLRELLDDLEIAEGEEMRPLAVIRASLDAQDASALSTEAGTAIFFFELPSCYHGLRCDQLQVVKAFSSERAALFERVYQLEDLRDRCAAVVVIEGKTLKRVLEPGDLVTPDCRLALAIKDGGEFDLDGEENGFLVDPAFIVAGERKSEPEPPKGGGGGGCNSLGFAPALLILLSPLALLKGRK